MLGFLRSSLAKLSARILLAGLITCLAGTMALASDGPEVQPGADSSENSETRPRRVTDTNAQPPAQPAAQPSTSEPAQIQVAYALYDRSISLASRPVMVEVPRTINFSLKSLAPPEFTPPPGRPAPQKSSTVASTAPMTAGEKFGVWARRFYTLGPYVGSAVGGMWKELQDNDDFKEDTVGNFFADSMTRAARGFAFAATAGFYEKALLASLFKQDPRYHRMPGKNSPGRRLLYAATRVFVTQGDNCGCHQPNYSFLLGAAGVTATANLWERSERTGPWHNVSRFYTHLLLVSMGNIVREFVSGQ